MAAASQIPACHGLLPISSTPVPLALLAPSSRTSRSEPATASHLRSRTPPSCSHNRIKWERFHNSGFGASRSDTRSGGGYRSRDHGRPRRIPHLLQSLSSPMASMAPRERLHCSSVPSSSYGCSSPLCSSSSSFPSVGSHSRHLHPRLAIGMCFAARHRRPLRLLRRFATPPPSPTTVYATAIDPQKGEIGILGPLCVGLMVTANALAGGAFDGASMNPSVAFGPALVSWDWTNHWVYWVGPLIGGAIAAIVYDFFFYSRPTHEQLPSSEP